MRQIPTTFGLLYFLEELEHTEAALLADDEAAILAPAFTQAIADWDGIFKNERASRRAITRAEAIVAVRNEQLDAATMSFAKVARGLAPALLDKVFNIAPGKFIRTNLRKQSEWTRDVIVVEIDKLGAQNAVSAFGASLLGFAKGALAALDERAKVKGDNAAAGNDVDEWKEGINSLRLTTWTELLKIADAKKYPRSWVEAFFRRGGTDEDKETPAQPAPTP